MECSQQVGDTECMSDKGPLESVIIPPYNRAWVVTEAIESVMAQTYVPYELIVVDDGSTDDTLQLLGRFIGITQVSQANAGVSAARNHGVRHARGRYIVFLVSDW